MHDAPDEVIWCSCGLPHPLADTPNSESYSDIDEADTEDGSRHEDNEASTDELRTGRYLGRMVQMVP